MSHVLLLISTYNNYCMSVLTILNVMFVINFMMSMLGSVCFCVWGCQRFAVVLHCMHLFFILIILLF